MTADMLFRSVPFELREGAGGDGNTLFGHAAVFERSTRIASWEGIFDEDIAPGAFARSLIERTPVLQFDHGKHPMVGSIPIGYFRSLAEDAVGLDVDAPLHDNWLVQPVRDAIKSKAIPGMSFRFAVRAERWRTAEGTLVDPKDLARLLRATNPNDPTTILKRTLLDVDLYELGPVVFPAYADTNVGVRSREVIDALSDPQVRAEVALALAGTPSDLSDAEGASSEGREAEPVEAEPQEAKPGTRITPPSVRDRGLRIPKGVLSNG